MNKRYEIIECTFNPITITEFVVVKISNKILSFEVPCYSLYQLIISMMRKDTLKQISSKDFNIRDFDDLCIEIYSRARGGL